MNAHEFLTNEGAYVHQHYEAEHDDGDVESGPGTWGHDEYDVYSGDSHELVLQRGILMDAVLINWDEVRFWEGIETEEALQWLTA